MLALSPRSQRCLKGRALPYAKEDLLTMALGITPRRREAWCRPVTDNPKYTFRCWLLRLGFIGEEFETARTHLLANLPGNAAWRQAS